ncbi:YbjN domain-containing protein [Mangrovicella endophytica]|uniref:YbjN domain-containing protein n=1 Tax=Mangrovicella endophytica TaxID=2066697 RepID=UPI0013000FD2|nr:YbjN domain-containing protein [Mangrovicella endophytica]
MSYRIRVAAAALGAVLCTSLAATSPAWSADVMFDQNTEPERIAESLRGFGSAVVEKAENGAPMIRGRIEGTGYAVFFYQCNDDQAACKSIGFYAAWEGVTATSEAINRWNSNRRFSRAYIDDSGNPAVEMDINLYGGVTVANFEDTADWWKIVIGTFRKEVIDAK